MTSINREALRRALDALDELLCGDTLDGEIWHEANNLYHKLELIADEADEETEVEIFHILDQEDGEQLAEASVTGEVLEVYNLTESLGTETLPDDCTGDDLYREIIDFAAFALGVGHGDIYLTDKDEARILRAE